MLIPGRPLVLRVGKKMLFDGKLSLIIETLFPIAVVSHPFKNNNRVWGRWLDFSVCVELGSEGRLNPCIFWNVFKNKPGIKKEATTKPNTPGDSLPFMLCGYFFLGLPSRVPHF